MGIVSSTHLSTGDDGYSMDAATLPTLYTAQLVYLAAGCVDQASESIIFKRAHRTVLIHSSIGGGIYHLHVRVFSFASHAGCLRRWMTRAGGDGLASSPIRSSL
jgi:hypothetical protein